MKFRIIETHAEDLLWRYIETYSPQTVRYSLDPNDPGDYRCFVAVGVDEEFIGLGIVDLGPLGLGPLAAQTVGCLENIFVLEPYRRQRVGTALLQAILSIAWKSHARHVWWTVDYDNSAAIAFYQSNGAIFLAEEDPQADLPEKYYTVVIPNPDLSPRSSVRL